MIAAVADTHALIWYLYRDARLSSYIEGCITIISSKGGQIALASVTLVEMVYLIEKGRIPSESFSLIATELRSLEGLFVEIPLDLSISRTLSRVSSVQVSEMPDRIIAATALHLNVPLISRDRRITLSDVRTIW